MAACVGMALPRWIRALVREWRRRAGAWRGLAGFGVGEEPQESCGPITPTSSNFSPEDNEAAPPIPEEFWVGAFLVPSGFVVRVFHVVGYCDALRRNKRSG